MTSQSLDEMAQEDELIHGKNLRLISLDGKRKAFHGQEDDNPETAKKSRLTPLSAEEKEALHNTQQVAEDAQGRDTLKNFLGLMRGCGVPNGKAIAQWSKAKDIILAIHPVGSTDVAIQNFSFKWIMEAHRPEIRLRRNGYELRVRCNNLVNEEVNRLATPAGAFRQEDFRYDTDVTTIQKAFQGNHKVLGLTAPQATEILDFSALGGIHAISGVNCLTFRTTPKDKLFFNDKLTTANADSNFEDFVKVLNERPCILSVIRKRPDVNDSLDRYMMKNFQACVNKGVWHLFNGVIGKEEGKLFEAWERDPTKELPDQVWMKHKMKNFKKLNVASKYASYVTRKCVGSIREYEIQQSVAVIAEGLWEHANIEAFFSMGITHVAIIGELTENGWVEIHVRASKDDEYVMPTIVPGTPFGIRDAGWGTEESIPLVKGKNDAPEDLLYDKSDYPETTEEPKAEDKSKEQKEQADAGFTGPTWKGRVIARDTDGDFVIGFLVKNRKERSNFRLGARIDVGLKMERNIIPLKRQLKAFAKICAVPTNKEGKKKHYLRNFLLGAGNSEYEKHKDRTPLLSVKDDNFSRMEGPQKARWNDFVEALGLNKRQREFLDHVFNTREFVTQLQGPPGTGKTKILSGVALSFVLLKIRTVMTAPSNAAVDQIMKNLLEVMEVLKRVDPNAHEEFKIVLVRPSALTKHELARATAHGKEGKKELNAQQADRLREKRKEQNRATSKQNESDRADKREVSQAESLAHELFAEIDSAEYDIFHEHNLSTHVYNSFLKKSQQWNANTTEGKEAANWIGWYKAMNNGTGITATDKRTFFKIGMDERGVVLTDSKVRVVVCTSNSANQLRNWGYQPWAVIVDEAASATEQDTCIPLSLGSRFNVIAGDHEQLRPFVKSRGHNTFADSLGTSLYERLYGHHNVPLFQLKVNYRMHPDISELPGILTYQWLECDPRTEVESDEYKFWQSFWRSDDAKRYRGGKRAPAFGGSGSDSIRRFAFVSGGGRSAPKEGSTSLRNNANINIITDLTTSLLYHSPSDENIKQLAGHKITILTPYKESQTELEKQVRWGLQAVDSRFGNIPVVSTVDSLQGGENEIIILELTPANEFNGGLIGFLREWNKINVAITRAKSVLIIVGNLDAWRQQLKVIASGLKCKKFAFLLIDLLDKGHVIDVETFDRLPASLKERKTLERQEWSQVMNHGDKNRLPSLKMKQMQESYNKQAAKGYEEALLIELQKLRLRARELKDQADVASTKTSPCDVR